MMFCDSGPPRNANLRSHHVQTPGIPVPGEQDTEQDTHAAGSNGRVLRVRHDIMPGPSWATVECMEVSQSVSLHKVKANLPENIACLGNRLHMATLHLSNLSTLDCRVDCQRFFLTLKTSMCRSGKPHYLKS